MLTIEIPGRSTLEIANVVFDYNGTLATDGEMTASVKVTLGSLTELVNVYVVTADTHGTVREQCHGLGVEVRTFPTGAAAEHKKQIVEQLGPSRTLCIGNGYNDIEMFQSAALSIAIMGAEGCSGKLLQAADVVVTSIEDALQLILKPKRLIATLRV